jgi:cell division protein FtsL
MRGAATGLAVVLMLLSAFLLYAVSSETRRLELGVQSSERRLERLRSEIAVLKADRAFLARPSRLESAARRLGMRPATARQNIRIEEIPLRRAAATDATALGAGP